ncbi:unnamed protein product [Orchesella dallaii]|uniref:Uncharacterized protein n=1 Tax=Orchesella dallaii TaxID=48710 RepID=A0ABP1QXS1_9HEXA
MVNIFTHTKSFSLTLNDPLPENAIISNPTHPLKPVFDELGIIPEDYEHYTTYFLVLPLVVVGIGFMALPVGLTMGFLYFLRFLVPEVDNGNYV